MVWWRVLPVVPLVEGRIANTASFLEVSKIRINELYCTVHMIGHVLELVSPENGVLKLNIASHFVLGINVT